MGLFATDMRPTNERLEVASGHLYDIKEELGNIACKLGTLAYAVPELLIKIESDAAVIAGVKTLREVALERKIDDLIKNRIYTSDLEDDESYLANARREQEEIEKYRRMLYEEHEKHLNEII